MSTMSEDRGAAALLCPASTGPAQPTMAEEPALAAYNLSRDKDTNGAPPRTHAAAGMISIAEFLNRLLGSRQKQCRAHRRRARL